MSSAPESVASYCEAIRRGDRRSIARTITLLESTRPDQAALGQAILDALVADTGGAIRVGITGPPGVGKSTFIEALGLHVLAQGHRVAVLAVDPSSPVSGGSILGDKTRMERLAQDERAFIRPSPSSGSLGGVAQRTREAMLVCEAAGFDVVLVETVGVGQGEIDVVDHADTIVLALMPGSGDSIQALKAGVMEIPDVIVVNKCDHPLADTMVREVRAVLALGPDRSWRVPVVKTEATRGEGITMLRETIDEHRALIEKEGTLSERRARNLRAEVLGIAAWRLRRDLEERAQADPEWQGLLDSVVRRETDPASAARKLLERMEDG
jgi:LAO/AO transport system kinase